MPNPRVSLRRDQLIPVNKAVNEKEQLEKGLKEEEGKKYKCLDRASKGVTTTKFTTAMY
jgi:hypothetical protein